MKRLIRLCLLPCAALALSACTQFPDLDHTRSPGLTGTEYPALVPVEPLLATATAGRVDAAATQAGLEGRVARLRARAARLRGSVLSGRERQRLAQGLS